jgi:hypothetical protein
MTSRTDLYKKLLKQVAKELGEKTAADIVKHVATLKLMRENIQIRLLAGERVDPLDVLKLDECLKRYLPQGKPVTVTVRFVDGDEPLPDAPPPSSPSPPPSPPSGPTPETTSAPSAPAGNVVPLRPVGSIHDQPGVPLKRLQNEPWRQFVGPVGDPYGSVNPFGTSGPIPNFAAPYRGR